MIGCCSLARFAAWCNRGRSFNQSCFGVRRAAKGAISPCQERRTDNAAYVTIQVAPEAVVVLSDPRNREALEPQWHECLSQAVAAITPGQMAPNAAMVSATGTPSPAIGRAMIASMPASRSSTMRAATWSFVPARANAST